MRGTHALIRLVRFNDVKEVIDPPTGWGGEPIATFVGADARAAGLPLGTPQAFCWIAIAMFDDEAAARASFASASEPPAWAEDAAETWSALLQPISHTGVTNWLTPDSPSPMFAVGPAHDANQPLAVLTTVGWNFGPELEMRRLAEFGAGIAAVRGSMDTTPGLISQNSFAQPPFIGGVDAVTFTLWRDTASMTAFAYGDGEHRRQMRHSIAENLYDRTSFTRLRALATCGTWRGSDPFAAA